MLCGCKKLKRVDFSNFDTSNVILMDELFSNCINLYHINFQNISSNSLLSMSKMFNKCEKLQFINLYSLEIDRDINISGILNEIPENISYCINNELKALEIKEEFNKKEKSLNDCINICPEEEKFLIPEKKKCTDNCIKDETYKYFFDNTCLIMCPEIFPYEMIFLGDACKVVFPKIFSIKIAN